MGDVIDFDDEKERKVKMEAERILGTAEDKPITAKPKRAPRRKPTPTASNVFNLGGNNNSIGQIAVGDTHHYHYEKPPRAPKPIVTPGEGVISEEQKVELTKLRNEWIEVHNSIRQKPLSYGSAWARINSAAGATSYHLIQSCNYSLAVKFIKKEIGKLRNMRSAPSKDDGWRNAKIGAIKARSKNQLGDAYAYKPYIKKNFKVESLADLSTDELQRTYAYIMKKTI